LIKTHNILVCKYYQDNYLVHFKKGISQEKGNLILKIILFKRL